MHVTKVYFIQLVLKIKYIEFEDRPKIFIKTCGNAKVFLPEEKQSGLFLWFTVYIAATTIEIFKGSHWKIRQLWKSSPVKQN